MARQPPSPRSLLSALTATLFLAAGWYAYLAHPSAMATSVGTLLGRPDCTAAPELSPGASSSSRDHFTLHAAIPAAYVPTPENRRRLVVVGDIHGADAALAALLAAVRFDPASDHLVAAGDMVNKGPDSPGVIRRLMDLGASAVRGNHEDGVLRAWRRQQAASESKEVAGEEQDKDAKFLAVARDLEPEHLEWLANLPAILTADPLPLYVVHGGLMPGVPLDDQDPWAVMNMRTLVYPHVEELRRRSDGATAPPPSSSDDEAEDDQATALATAAGRHSAAVPVDTHQGQQWAAVWNRFQKGLARRRRRTVVYGHDAKTGYSERKYAVGLDSGCVAGGDLTALVIEAKEGARGFTHETKRVSCKKL